jgi:hypothetical protein
MFRCLPDDPKIQEMDDIVRTWMFFSWAEDKEEQSVLLRNQGCLIGSFWNAKAAQEMLGFGDSQTISVSEEEVDEAFQKYVVEDRIKKEELKKIPKKKKKKRLVLKKENS